MSQHLILYASKAVTAAEVSKWCHTRAFELTDVPSDADRPIVEKVQAEMDRLRHTDDRLEHWSNWCGVRIWDFLVWEAHKCNKSLVNRAIVCAQYDMKHHAGLRSSYPGRDFTKDEAIEFLCSHIGYVVWGDNNGI